MLECIGIKTFTCDLTCQDHLLKDREELERRRDEDAQAISNTRKESEDYFGKKGKWKSTNCMKLILKL